MTRQLVQTCKAQVSFLGGLPSGVMLSSNIGYFFGIYHWLSIASTDPLIGSCCAWSYGLAGTLARTGGPV